MVDIENITNVFVITEFEGQGQGYDTNRKKNLKLLIKWVVLVL